MYQSYQVKEKWSRGQLLARLSLALVVLLTFGFAGGVLYLLFLLVPIEQWLVDRGSSQGTIDAILSVLVVGWILFGLGVTAVYGRIFLTKRNLLGAACVCCASLAAAGLVFFFLLDTKLMLVAGRLGQESTSGERLTFGSYPDLQDMERLEDEGYDGIITLLNPALPFEQVLLQEELRNSKDVGIRVVSAPMLPWVSSNEGSLETIRNLVNGSDKRYYIHCYLGEHRVDLVRREVQPNSKKSTSVEKEPLEEDLERGDLVPYEDERIVLGPYPTDEEWLDVVVQREVEEVVSTLDPGNPQDRPWIERERRIAEDNDLDLTLKPLDATSPDPAKVEEIARYTRNSERKIYLHDFLEGERFEALERELDRQPPRGTDEGGG